MSETATGIMQQPSAMATMLAACASLQTWFGTGYADRIYVDGGETVAMARPFAAIDLTLHETDRLTGHASGTLEIWIEDDVIDAYTGETLYANAGIWFRNRIGALLTDLVGLANGPGGYLAIPGKIADDGPFRVDGDQEVGEGDHYACKLIVPFGV